MDEFTRQVFSEIAHLAASQLEGRYAFCDSRWYRKIQDARGNWMWSRDQARDEIIGEVMKIVRNTPETVTNSRALRAMGNLWGLNQLTSRMGQLMRSPYLPAPSPDPAPVPPALEAGN
jgi:hypothetical protein